MMSASLIPTFAWAIAFLPLVSAVVVWPLSHVAGARAGEWFACVALTIAAFLSLWLLYAMAGSSAPIIAPLFTWIESGTLSVAWELRIDVLSSIMFAVVSLVSALVHIYSVGYMHEDDSRPRFFAYLGFFTFAMLMLAGSNNFLQLFFGWEGVGLASYLLIGFWHHKHEANDAAIKAFIVNRVGDAAFVLGLALLFLLTGTLDYDLSFAILPELATHNFILPFGYEVHALSLAAGLLLFGAMGKSAQLLLHTWLPDAMEGPTPVSALIHAATMVTAGIFLIARAHPLFALAPSVLTLTLIIGAATALFAASVALVQNDIKRVIAYSTCSQLGYMFAALGLGAWGVAMFHLFTHAFFKALLFLGAGSVIHAVHGEQDMRKMGGLARHLPWSWGLMLVGTLALTGFPLTAGYYSKDAIIETAFLAESGLGLAVFWALLLAAAMTSFYSWRLMFLTFHGAPRKDMTPHESPPVMLLPLLPLAAGALAAGLFFAPLFIGERTGDFWHGLFDTQTHHEDSHHDDHHGEGHHDIPLLVLVAPSIVMLAGFALAWLFYLSRPSLPAQFMRRLIWLYRFLLHKWFFDELYHLLFVRPAYWLGRLFWQTGDGTLIDGLGPNGMAQQVQTMTRAAIRMQTGYLYHYAFAMAGGAALLLGWLFLRMGGG